MMGLLDEIAASCPYCDSALSIEADPELEGQRFIEDCPVCCAPIDFELRIDADGGWRLTARRDDE